MLYRGECTTRYVWWASCCVETAKTNVKDAVSGVLIYTLTLSGSPASSAFFVDVERIWKGCSGVCEIFGISVGATLPAPIAGESCKRGCICVYIDLEMLFYSRDRYLSTLSMADKPSSLPEQPSSAAKAEIPPSSMGAEAPKTTPVGEASTKPLKKPGYTNPAFKAMGLPPIRLPSRNWMIFWTVVSVGVGGYAYDRYQMKQARKKWMTRVEHLGKVPLPPNVTARKVMVYVAPPPNDYLDESLSVFRRYVKPVLNAGGVDFEIKSENRQGVIRSLVAADVRAVRKEYLENEQKRKAAEDAKKWYNKVKGWFTRSQSKKLTNEELEKMNAAEFDYKKLLGTYYKNEQWINSDIINEDSFVSDGTAHGGVICIGRGAYKEYLHGLHEGLLGPLEKPLDHDDLSESTKTEDKSSDSSNLQAAEKPNTEDVVVAPTVQALDEIVKPAESLDTTIGTTTEVTSETTETTETAESTEAIAGDTNTSASTEPENSSSEGENDEDEEKPLPIPKPFIDPSEYSTAPYAPELPTSGPIKGANGVTAVFQQPILVIPVYHLLGFLQMPWRIWRFYNTRERADEYGRAACAVVENMRSRFVVDDVDWAKDEEEDWPKKWVKNSQEKGSEWTQELVFDERVLEKLWVYDAGKVVETKAVERVAKQDGEEKK